ncbi:MAG: rhomboid family intramembrane serine protease [Rhodobacter sp.]|nr:rhomboid family intramembrane serine protease [Rhodobacter sp.]
MTDTDLNAAPFNRLPWAVWLLILAVLGVEAVLSLADLGLVGGAQGIGWRIAAIQDHAFSSAIQQSMIDGHHYLPRFLMRYVTFSFVAGNLMHALFGAVLIAALGKAVAEAFGNLRFLVLALAVPVVAAFVFGLVTAQDQLGWLFGAMPMAFALVGGFTWLKVHEAGADRARRLRAFGLIAMLLLARLAFGLLAEGGPAWLAEFAAFALAYGASALVLGPGSWQRTRARLRG